MAKTKSKSKPIREPTPTSSSASGSDSESDYSSDDTVEDEDGEELTPALDAAILRTLAAIRRKDASVYAGEKILETNLAAAQQSAKERGLGEYKKQQSAKPFLLKDHHRAHLLEGGESEDEVEEQYFDTEEAWMTNVQAERKARDEAVSAFKALGEEDSDEEDEDENNAGGLLVKRRADEVDEDDDAAYRAFLLEMGGGEGEVRRALGIADAPVSKYREDSVEAEDAEAAMAANDEKESRKEKKKKKKASKEDKATRAAKKAKADEDFLMDYILNRGWLDREEQHVPTYDEIVGRPKGEESEDEGQESDAGVHPWGKIDEEDDFDDRAEEFETKYNFRFEEPGADTITTHPREIPSLVRRDDDTRKLKRKAREERKAAEKAAREEETRRQKGEQRREMERQLAAIKKELGEDGMDWAQLEEVLDGDFDEGQWERVIGAMLEAKADAEDDTKPEWDDDDMGNYEDYDDGYVEPVPWDEQETYDPAEDEDAPINMDADFVDEPKSKKKSKKDRKKGKKGKNVEEDGDLSVEARAAKLKAAAEAHRALDHEDIVADLPTRFKYTKGTPVTFGLTAEEILLATDAELNALTSVKHIAPYRRGGLGIAGKGLGKRVRDLKTTLAERMRGGDEAEEGQSRPAAVRTDVGPSDKSHDGEASEGRKGKRLGKKEREKLKLKATEEGGEQETPAPVAGVKRVREEPAFVLEPQQEEVAGEGGERESGGRKKRRKKKGKSATASEA